jgi:hypothetical protein
MVSLQVEHFLQVALPCGGVWTYRDKPRSHRGKVCDVSIAGI